MNESKGFIAQTAEYYNVPEHIVENFYYKYCLTENFHRKLEEYIKDREA